MIEAGVTRPVVDLSECTFVDTAGLNVFVEVSAQLAAQNNGGRLALVNPLRQARRVLEVVDADPSVRVFQHRSAIPWLKEPTPERRTDNGHPGSDPG